MKIRSQQEERKRQDDQKINQLNNMIETEK
jgi:hypothetical protein